jgi:hypothetical protein
MEYLWLDSPAVDIAYRIAVAAATNISSSGHGGLPRVREGLQHW